MLTNLRNFLKSQLGRYYLTNLLYALKPKNRKLIITRSKDICIEGYPRSANTFAVLLVEQCSVKPLNIAHHMHSSSQLKMSVKQNTPSVLLLRHPKDAVISNVLREDGLTLEVALNWYINFHKDLLPFKRNIVVWEFEQFTSEPQKSLEQLSKHFGLEIDYSLYDKKQIYNQIDELDRKYKKKADFDKVNTRPNENKKSSKAEIEKSLMINNRLTAKLEKAIELYEDFL